MSNTSTSTETGNRGGACRTLCWLIGLTVGGYGAYALYGDFSLPPGQAGLYGLAAGLVLGALLRLALCRGRGNRVRERVREAKIAADAAVARPRVKVSRSKAAPADAAPAPAPQPEPAPKGGSDAPAAETAPPAPAGETPPEGAGSEGGDERPLVLTPEPPAGSGGEDTVAASAPADAETEETEGQGRTAAVAPPAEPSPEPPARPRIVPMKPKGMEAPETGLAEDLDRLEGLDEAMRAALNAAGIYHSRQLVTMNRRELAWLEENIAEGRALAESWRKQAIARARKGEG